MLKVWGTDYNTLISTEVSVNGGADLLYSAVHVNIRTALT